MKASDLTDKLKQYPVASICTVLLVIFLVINFLRGGILDELSAKEVELEARIRVINSNIKNSDKIGEDAEVLNAIVEKINSLLFIPDERAVNVSFFYEFEEKAGVRIADINQQVQPDPIYGDKGPRKLNLHSTLVYEVTLQGSFKNTLRLLHELNRVDPLIRVADFQISRAASEASGDNVDTQLRVLVMAKKKT